MGQSEARYISGGPQSEAAFYLPGAESEKQRYIRILYIVYPAARRGSDCPIVRKRRDASRGCSRHTQTRNRRDALTGRRRPLRADGGVGSQE